MSNTYGDASVAAMRALISVIDREVAEVAPDGKLQLAWGQLVQLLALGPAPELRACPTCQSIGMRAASRCMVCWSALAPLPPIAATTVPATD